MSMWVYIGADPVILLHSPPYLCDYQSGGLESGTGVDYLVETGV